MLNSPIPIYTKFIGFFIAILGCAVFSFLETSITALRLFKLKELAKTIRKYKTLFYSLERHPNRVLASILIGSSLANAAAAALITDIFEEIFIKYNLSEGLGCTVGISFATISILIFGEIIPKNLAKTCGDRLFKSTLWLAHITFYVLYPFVSFLLKVSDFFVNKLGGKVEKVNTITSEKEVQFLIKYIDEKGLMDQQKTGMLQSVFKLSQTPVKEIMLPAADVVSINNTTPIKKALEVLYEYRYSRLPVYDETKENIIGMIHQRDLFGCLQTQDKKTVQEFVRPIMFIPESVKVNQLLLEFRRKHMHMAMIINEFGSITGLVTLEDVLEEIVGDINDEDEIETKRIIALEQGGWLVDARIDLNELSKALQIKFDSEDAISLGGFLTEKLQRLPQKGERFLYKDFCFQVQNASKKRVKQVLIFEEKQT